MGLHTENWRQRQTTTSAAKRKFLLTEKIILWGCSNFQGFHPAACYWKDLCIHKTEFINPNEKKLNIIYTFIHTKYLSSDPFNSWQILCFWVHFGDRNSNSINASWSTVLRFRVLSLLLITTVRRSWTFIVIQGYYYRSSTCISSSFEGILHLQVCECQKKS
jgi:hypothetical protein